MTMKWLTCAVLLCGFFKAEAQVINAATCNANDVQTAFNSVTSSTTTVNIPAGTCNWTTQVSLTVPSGSTTLSILGAGDLNTTGGGDVTVIVDNYASTNSLLITATGSASSYFRLAGMTFKSGSGLVKQNAMVAVQGFSQNTRVDHDHFSSNGTSTGSVMLKFANWTYGVADHNIVDLSGASQGIWTWEDEYNNVPYGDGSWADLTGLGSSRFMFIENNVFNNDNAPGSNTYGNDCTTGGRFVVRYNTFNSASLQVHPTGGSGRNRGCRAWEVYNNTFIASNTNPVFNAYFLSSGTGVMWGNSVPTGYETFVSIHSVLSDNSDYSQTAAPNGWGYCGTSFNGTGSAWDQNTNPTTGYACLDQPGRGQGDLLEGNFPNACDKAAGCPSYNGSWPSEALEPIYEWIDTWSPVPGYGYPLFNDYEPAVLVQNQDFYLYTPSFNGTSGVGSGTLSARPSTCTPLVAYWATDTTTLYQCSSKNTWTVYYTPYTYPHPLTQGSPQSPQAPTGLAAVVN
jgi:hypothetical protein